MTIQAGTSEPYAVVGLMDSSTGAKITDVDHTTSGLAIRYQLDNGTIGSLTPASMSAGGSHVAGGIYHRGDGDYVIGLSSATAASVGMLHVWVELDGAKSIPDRIRVVAYDPNVDALGAVKVGTVYEWDNKNSVLQDVEIKEKA